jgi:hypothetical protein
VALFFTASFANAQLGTTTVTNVLDLTVVPEAALTIQAGHTFLTSPGTNFSPYTGTTNFTYFIRTTKVGGTGTITLEVTADFIGTPGASPSVVSPPTSSDALTYGCAVAAPATQCSGPVTASHTSPTTVATFSANAHSTFAGNSGSVAWSLTNDPLYETGNYQATVTYTISAT